MFCYGCSTVSARLGTFRQSVPRFSWRAPMYVSRFVKCYGLQTMPPKKSKRRKVVRYALLVEEQEQSVDPRRLSSPEGGTAPDLVPQLEPKHGINDTEEDAPARMRAIPRVVTCFIEDEKYSICFQTPRQGYNSSCEHFILVRYHMSK